MLPELKTFDSGGPLGAFRTGEADATTRFDKDASFKIGQSAKEGGYLQGAKTALEYGKIDLASKLETLGADKQARFYDAMGRAASGADTPEKWAAMTSRMSSMFGPESVKGFENFGMRSSAIALSMTALEQAKLKLQREEAARAGAAASRAAALHPMQLEAMRLENEKAKLASPEGRAATFRSLVPAGEADPRYAGYVGGIPDKPGTTIRLGDKDRLIEPPTPGRPGSTYTDVTPARAGGPEVSHEMRGDEHKLRQQFLAQSGEYISVRDAYGRLQASSQVESAASDMAIIFNIMKMYDPGSVVRETEFATAQNAAGVPDRVRAQWNRIMSGERLAPAQRKDFLNVGQRLYGEQNARFKQTRDEFGRIATESGLDPRRVLVDIERRSDGSVPPSGPKPPAPTVAPGTAPPPPADATARAAFERAPVGHRIPAPAGIVMPDGTKVPAGTPMEKGADGSYRPVFGEPWDRLKGMRE